MTLPQVQRRHLRPPLPFGTVDACSIEDIRSSRHQEAERIGNLEKGATMQQTTHAILVCLDGSEPAKRALEISLNIAQASGYSIQIVSVLDLYEVELYENLYFSHDEIDDMKSKRDIEIVSPARKKAEERNIPVFSETRVGRPLKQILRFIDEHHPEWVAVGRSGRGKIEQIFEGSVSRGLAARVSVPILIVP